MNNDQKPRIRITIERISVTTMRTRSEKTYCEICGRALTADVRTATESDKVIDAAATAIATENEKEK